MIKRILIKFWETFAFISYLIFTSQRCWDLKCGTFIVYSHIKHEFSTHSSECYALCNPWTHKNQPTDIMHYYTRWRFANNKADASFTRITYLHAFVCGQAHVHDVVSCIIRSPYYITLHVYMIMITLKIQLDIICLIKRDFYVHTCFRQFIFAFTSLFFL